MTDQGSQTGAIQRNFRLVSRDASLGALFRRQTRLYSTRTSEGFLSTLEENGKELILWLLRFPLSQNSGEDRRFISRIEKMQQALAPGVFHSAGIDEKGSAFVALNCQPLDSIMKLSMPIGQRVIAWTKVVEVVARLHQLGVCLGDISEDSFVWDPDKGPQLIGVMGTFDSAGSATAMLPPPTTLPYLAPEQRGVFVAEPVFDVYALGVYGYRLLTGMYPNAELANSSSGVNSSGRPPIEAKLLQDSIPDWVNTSIGIALQPNAESRFESATELFDVINSEGQSIRHDVRTSVWTSQTAELEKRLVSAARDSAVFEVDSSVSESHADEVDRNFIPKEKFRVVALWGGAGAIGIFLAFVMFWLFSFLGSGRIEPYSEAHRSYVPPELEKHLAIISDRALSEARRKKALNQLARIENPFTYPILASLVQGANDSTIRKAALVSLSDSIRKTGLKTTANVFSNLLSLESLGSSLQEGTDPFLSLVRSTDAMQPMEARLGSLEKAHKLVPKEALKVAAGIAIDTEGPAQIDVLRKILLADPGTLCLSETSCEPRQRVAAVIPSLELSGLLLAHSAISGLFQEERLQRLWAESPETQAYVLEYLYYENRERFVRVLQTGIDGGGIGPLARQLVEFLQLEGSELDDALTVSLIRSLVGVVDGNDVFRFGRWKSKYASKALVIVSGILSKRNRASALDVFDTAIAKTHHAGPEKAMLEFVRLSEWSQRTKLIYPVAVILHSEAFSLEEISSAFDAFEPYSARNFFDTLVKTKNSKSITLALLRFGNQLPSVQIMALLKHPNPKVRMEAVRALAGRNDISVMRDILSAYEAERDPEVRRLYQRLHWVTGGR